jgi:hypothetical protein
MAISREIKANHVTEDQEKYFVIGGASLSDSDPKTALHCTCYARFSQQASNSTLPCDNML